MSERPFTFAARGGALTRGGLAAVATSLLGACALMPDHQRPDMPVAPAYSIAAATASAQPVADLAWQDFFTDPALRRLIDLALANNRDLRLAVLNIEQARAQFQVRQADQFPALSLGASGSRAPVAPRASSTNSDTAGTANTTVTSYNVGLVASAYELDLFGRVASLKEVALSQYLATEESRKAVQIGLVAAVANAYLKVLGDAAQTDVLRQTLDTREASLRLIQLRVNHGIASELDLHAAQSLTEAARAALAQLTRQRVLDVNALTLLVGQPLPAGLLPGEPPEAVSVQMSTHAATGSATQSLEGAVWMAELPTGLPSELLTQRPDIRAAEQQLRAANANIGAARAAFFPRIALTTAYGSTSNELAGLFNAGTFGWTFAPQLTLPLFDAGRNRANLAVAEVNKDIAVAQYDKAIQTAFREVADALGGRTALEAQVRAQTAQAKAEAARYQLAELRYRHGVASFLDALDAQRSLLAIRLTVLQTRLLQMQNQVALYRALGGGWRTASAEREPVTQPPAAPSVR